MSRWKMSYDKSTHYYHAEREGLTGLGKSAREAKDSWRFIKAFDRAFSNLHKQEEGIYIGESYE